MQARVRKATRKVTRKVGKKARTVTAKERTAKERMAKERMAKRNGTGQIFLPKVVDQIVDPQMELPLRAKPKVKTKAKLLRTWYHPQDHPLHRQHQQPQKGLQKSLRLLHDCDLWPLERK